MNNHKLACVLLLVICGGIFFGVHKLRTRAVAAEDASKASKEQAEMAEQQKRIADIKLKSIDAKTAELRKIYGEWLPHFEGLKNSQTGEQRITEVVREGDVFLLSQKFEAREVDKKSSITHALFADLVVEDDYTKTMNWLGKLEETIPNCRITKCLIRRGERGNNIHMELTVQVPVFKDISAKKS